MLIDRPRHFSKEGQISVVTRKAKSRGEQSVHERVSRNAHDGRQIGAKMSWELAEEGVLVVRRDGTSNSRQAYVAIIPHEQRERDKKKTTSAKMNLRRPSEIKTNTQSFHFQTHTHYPLAYVKENIHHPTLSNAQEKPTLYRVEEIIYYKKRNSDK